MNSDQRLNQVADRYRSLGFKVVVRPKPEDLPDFAKDFQVEILATGDHDNVLASAKSTPSDLEADSNVPKYAEIIERQPGWRFDVFVLGPDIQVKPELRQAKEPHEQEIRDDLDAVEKMAGQGFVEQSLVAAWAALEAVLRRRLRSAGEAAGWGTSPRTMLNQLYSLGILTTRLLRDLEALFLLRSAIVHGFSAPVLELSSVQFLVDTARRLLTEAEPVKQTA